MVLNRGKYLQILLDDVIVLIANFRIPQEHKILYPNCLLQIKVPANFLKPLYEKQIKISSVNNTSCI